jgi:energy-coupling factor transport system substrate-specific component
MEVEREMVEPDPTMAAPAALPATSWRTRDIVVAAVIGVAFGVVFWVWGLAWPVFDPLNAIFPVLKDSLYAIWLVPAVLAPLIVRKPGAALFAEMVAAALSALLGSQWGIDTLLSGFVQGAAAEIVFGFTLYRSWSPAVLGLAAIASAVAAWAHDWVLYYADVSLELQLIRLVLMALSALVFVALGSMFLARTLRGAGVLEGFPA